MTKNSQTRTARRRLLKALAGGSGAVVVSGSLPQRWGRPHVQSVVLPAHADATPGGVYLDLGVVLANGLGEVEPSRSPIRQLVDGLVPSAVAGGLEQAAVCVTDLGGGQALVRVALAVDCTADLQTVTSGVVRYQGTVAVGGSLTSLAPVTPGSDCNSCVDTVRASVASPLGPNAATGTLAVDLSLLIPTSEVQGPYFAPARPSCDPLPGEACESAIPE